MHERLDLVGAFDLSEVDGPRSRAHEQHAPVDGAVDVVSGQVADFDAGELAIGGHEILFAHEVRHAGGARSSL